MCSVSSDDSCLFNCTVRANEQGKRGSIFGKDEKLERDGSSVLLCQPICWHHNSEAWNACTRLFSLDDNQAKGCYVIYLLPEGSINPSLMFLNARFTCMSRITGCTVR
jgi:hypothetical protein